MYKKILFIITICLSMGFIPFSFTEASGAIHMTTVYTSTNPSEVRQAVTNYTFSSNPDDPSAPDQETVSESSYGTEENAEGASTQAIFGDDDRVVITNNKGFPNRCIAYLRAYYIDGHVARGTAFIVGKNKAFTAAHCVYMPEHGGMAYNVRIWPGYNDNKSPKAPYGSYDADYFLTWSPWTDNRNRDYDYAVISLKQQVGAKIGHFGLRARPKKTFIGTNIYVAGYPADLSTKKLCYRALGQITNSSTRLLAYNADMMKGESGGPVYRKDCSYPH